MRCCRLINRRGVAIVALLAFVAFGGVQWRFNAVNLPRYYMSAKELKVSIRATSDSPSKPKSPDSNFTSFDWRDPYRFRFYQPDLICAGCYQSIVKGKAKPMNASSVEMTCGELIQQETKRIVESTTGTGSDVVDPAHHEYVTLQAASVVAERYPDKCHSCDSKSCSSNEKIYLRFDDASPTILQSWVFPISKLLPKDKIFPKEGVQDPKAYMDDPAHKYSMKHHYYWEYNPSIVTLKGHENLIPEGILPSPSQEEKPAYLSTHRMSIVPTTFHQSHLDLGDFPHGGWMYLEHINFSFLSQDMKVLLEGIFYVGYADYRIFNLHNQLYLGMAERLHKMWLVPSNQQNSQDHGVPVKVYRDMYQPDSSPFELHVAEQHLCCAQGCEGKNFNFFTTQEGKIWAQTSPAGPLVVQQFVDCAEAKDAATSETRVYTHETVPTMSFATIDEPYMASLGVFFNHRVSSHRGTACCARMKHNGLDLLIGISHRRDEGQDTWKSKWMQYTSNFYATLAEPPFSLVAMSGSFCMGHPNNPQDEAINHWVPLTRLHNYTFGGIDYDKCPMVAFIQAIVENPYNPDTVIIGYGINDTINRFVEVSKANILQLLFDPYGTRGTTSVQSSH